jgi:hypothetical protein
MRPLSPEDLRLRRNQIRRMMPREIIHPGIALHPLGRLPVYMVPLAWSSLIRSGSLTRTVSNRLEASGPDPVVYP